MKEAMETQTLELATVSNALAKYYENLWYDW